MTAQAGVSYATISEAHRYYHARNLAATHLDDQQLDGLLLRASEMIDAACLFAGAKSQSHQIRAWPRHDVRDEAGRDVRGVPQAVRDLTIALALMIGDDEKEAYRMVGLAQGISQERIGDIQLRYRNEPHHLPPFLRPLRAYMAANKPITITRS